MIRKGYNVTDNPIGAEDVTFNILAPGVVRHHYTAGASWKLDADSALTGALAFAPSNDVQTGSLLNNFAPGLALREKIEICRESRAARPRCRSRGRWRPPAP